jgi:hypothetical protein
MFRSKFIGWLPFESLIRQVGIDFEWELIIAEEIDEQEHQPFGKENILKYKNKLEDLGCVRFEYIGLKKWISLAEKIHLLKENCNKETKIFVWHSADYYSAPKRLSTSYKIFKEHKPHLFLPRKAIYYDIANGSVALHNPWIEKYKGRKDDVIGKAWDYNIIKNFPRIYRRTGVDGFLFNQCRKIAGGKGHLKIYYDESDNWKYALSTQGLNNITHQRGHWMAAKKGPYCDCPININETIPADILSRLKGCKKFIKKHRRGLPR